FLNEVMDLDLPAQAVAALDARTEGWIAGLQLAALSMQGRDDVAGFVRAFAGDDRYIVDYLVEEVLERQPEHVHIFLLQTSILHALAAHDFERAAALVERVARATIRGSNQSARLVEWLKVLPDDLVRARPVLSTYYAFALFGMGEMDAAAALLTDAERWLDLS